MKNDNIRIKRKSPFFLYGALTLVVLIAGVLLIALPFLNDSAENGLPFFIGGTIVAAIGLAGYVFILLREICKPDALVLTNKGFTNYLIGGKNGVYVEWTDVASIKIFGLSKAPSLGLTLEDNDSYLQLLNGRDMERASENIAMELPVIAIPQRCVKLPIAELKALFSKMVKGAISWETYSTQGKKPEQKPEHAEETPVTVPAEEPEVLSMESESEQFTPVKASAYDEAFAKAYAPAPKQEPAPAPKEEPAPEAFIPKTEPAPAALEKTAEIPTVSAPAEDDIILCLDDNFSEEDQRIVSEVAEEKKDSDALDDVILLDLNDD